MICHEHKFIFVHIPKTGGTSIRRALPEGDDCSVDGSPHGTLAMYHKHYGEPIFSSYFKFAITRNPWDRVVSAYHFNRMQPEEILDQDIAPNWKKLIRYAKEHSFDEWVKTPPFADRQLYFISLEFDFTRATTHGLDFVGDFASLQASYEEACKRIGIPSTTLPDINHGSSHHDYRSQYSPETSAIIHEQYRNEIELFGYEF
ncbi:sulfotransferase family 2 domain-containing protein [Rubellicoccus peritrichatus]|uniref:Sulfotransferase family 2 domain-containing protein n=1 Tax=Rubellicoccus peritrichatus TaxID=3080537 RepID=A0AAQ3LCP5_9BACT|nr:sulfotransferase family 2 domain-containing protein [Puniceicoccus sp. CR14]WOO42037.1 sulfotransferase family 2 domain-containing protein [Puniceicoccus sp. CR14]